MHEIGVDVRQEFRRADEARLDLFKAGAGLNRVDPERLTVGVRPATEVDHVEAIDDPRQRFGAVEDAAGHARLAQRRELAGPKVEFAAGRRRAGSAEEMLETAERKILEIAQKGIIGETITLIQAMSDAYERI